MYRFWRPQHFVVAPRMQLVICTGVAMCLLLCIPDLRHVVWLPIEGMKVACTSMTRGFTQLPSWHKGGGDGSRSQISDHTADIWLAIFKTSVVLAVLVVVGNSIINTTMRCLRGSDDADRNRIAMLFLIAAAMSIMFSKWQ